MQNPSKLTIDSGIAQMLEKAAGENIETAYDRAAAMEPQCGFGQLGLCCTRCLQGPCRISPFADGPKRGICGVDADTMVARNLLAMAAQGTANHVDHAREAALALLATAEGKAPYRIADIPKLRQVAAGLGLEAETKPVNELAKEVALKALEDFQKQEGTLNWLDFRANPKSVETWQKLGIMPGNAHMEVSRAVTRTAMGCDADPANLILGTMTMGLVDGFAGLHMATDLQDILFGTPAVVQSSYRLGVIREDAVNIAVHGHVPLLSEKVAEWANKMAPQARAAGAADVNVVGICCTGNEVLSRRGVPVATNFVGQELAIVTGALDAVVVDIQCIMPGLKHVADCFHTEVITTLPYAKLPGATHVAFEPERADEAAQEIVRKAIAAYGKRDRSRVSIPKDRAEMVAGFSVEQIVAALAKVDPVDPLRPVIDNIVNGNIFGAVAIVGCTNVKVKQDWANTELAKHLLAENVLIVSTGCAAHSLAKHEMMLPDGRYAGPKLSGVLKAIGEANGLPSLPPALHMGSCVDNSRVANLLNALATKLNVGIRDLPVAGSSPEVQSAKAISIGAYFLANGVDVHVGVAPQVLGSKLVTSVLTAERDAFPITADGLFGGKIIYEPDPKKAAGAILERMAKKRKALGI